MDDHHDASVTRSLGSGVSRRTALRAALGGLVATGAGLTALAAAEATSGKGHGHGKHRGKHKKAQGKTQDQRTPQLPPGGSSVGPISWEPVAEPIIPDDPGKPMSAACTPAD